MEIQFNTVVILDILGAIQGLVLGAVLLLANGKKRRKTLFMGLFVLIFAYSFIPVALIDSNIAALYPKWSFLPRICQWLLAPLFLLYVQETAIFQSGKKAYWTLVPGLAFVLFQLGYALWPSTDKILLRETVWFNRVLLTGVLYSFLIVLYTLRYIHFHGKEVQHQYAYCENKELLWAKRYLWCCLGLALVHILRFFIDLPFYDVFFTLANVAMLYWISICALAQQQIVALIGEMEKKRGLSIENLDKPMDMQTRERYHELVDLAESHLQSSAIFTQKELTIIDVAKAIDVHPRQLSQAINQIRGQNFNTFVNNFRIAKAEMLLNDPAYEQLSIEGIGAEVGFQSKSSFYSAFKKRIGTTPHRFKERIAS